MAETKKINATVDLVKSGVEFKLNGGTILSDDGTSHYLHSQSNLYLYSGSSNTMTLSAAGNVGIGLTSPSYALEVAGGTDNVIAGFQSTDNRASIVIQDNDTASYIGSEGGLLYFNRGTGNGTASAANNGMVIDASGNVGIGTTSPQAKLHISGGSATMEWGTGVGYGIKYYGGGTYEAGFRLGTGSRSLDIYSIYDDNADGINLYT
jgi:hypothetical protein